jgi:hypothetical protein
MKQRLLQSLANSIAIMVNELPDGSMRDYMFEFGAQLNAYAIVFHNLWLD